MTETVTNSRARERPSWYRWYALGVLVLVYVSSHVDRQIMGILLEPIKGDLGASDTQMGFLIGITFALFYATLGIPIAMLADRGNRRNIITIAITVWSGMTVLCGYVQSFAQLALARIGVGIGEAGSTPPTHSMISDMFPASERGTAMGIYAMGINIGLLVAYLGGGWMSEHWGWRTTFIVVGLPGLLIALLVRLTVDEPVRGASDSQQSLNDAPPFMNVARHLWRTPAARHVIFGSSLAGFVGYGMTLWLPAFFVRSHGLSQTEVGLTLALVSGIVGGIGTFTAGKFADMLAARDVRWFAWVVAIGKGGLVPFLVLFFLMQDFTNAILIYLIPAFFGGFYLAPTFAMIQSLVPPEMRAVAAAITLFMLNIIGMGIGPQGVGILSDVLSTEYGKESLRYSLMIFGTVNIWCAFHYFVGARTLKEDIARAQANT
ncbi:MAG: MFS transporter [Pseudomonadales bacterium]|nr:MFS transporter [Pseudomonadales bacterium]MBO7007038.1 MFS transporter [Pseudomonadales bacterium]